MVENRRKELEETIKLLEKQEVPESVVESYRKELGALQDNTEQNKQEEVRLTGGQITDSGFVINVTPEQMEKAGSKFASPGLHLSEMGMPEWENPGVSIRFPFTIVEEGPDHGKESKIVCGIGETALWKLKEVLTAVSVPHEKTEDGKVRFNHMAIAGKQFMSLWTKQKDSRPAEEGGKGTEYTKATSAYPAGTKVEDLGL